MSLDAAIADLAHCRSVLVRVTVGLGVTELDYRAFPDAKSNGEILLHIAGFEFLVLAGARLAQGERIDPEPWAQLKPGFAREAGFTPPTGRELSAYLGHLGQVRQDTIAYLMADSTRRGLEAERFTILQLAQELSATDREADRSCYERLARGVSTSFADDGSVDSRGMVDIPALLLLHETYHRGQLTLNKYIRSRKLREAAS